MKRTLIVLTLVALLVLVAVVPVFAHRTGPCGPEGDFTGREYATHHISEFAKAGDLGNEGHKPGVHQGYSTCLGVHE